MDNTYIHTINPVDVTGIWRKWVMFTGTWLLGTSWLTVTWCVRCLTLDYHVIWRRTPLTLPTPAHWWGLTHSHAITVHSRGYTNAAIIGAKENSSDFTDTTMIRTEIKYTSIPIQHVAMFFFSWFSKSANVFTLPYLEDWRSGINECYTSYYTITHPLCLYLNRYKFLLFQFLFFSHWTQYVVTYSMHMHVVVRIVMTTTVVSPHLCVYGVLLQIYAAYGPLCSTMWWMCNRARRELCSNIFFHSFFLSIIYLPLSSSLFFFFFLRVVKSQCGGQLQRRLPTGSLRQLQMSGVMGSSPGRWCHTERGLTGTWATKM